MSTQSLEVTVAGWIGSEVRSYHESDGGVPFASFRLASTRRVRDRETGAWRDGRTEWFTVKAWRVTALNVAQSLRKGDPVVVHGRLSTEEWVAAEGVRTSLVLVADAVGHDLSFGSTQFRRTVARAERPDLADVTQLAELPDDGSAVLDAVSRAEPDREPDDLEAEDGSDEPLTDEARDHALVGASSARV